MPELPRRKRVIAWTVLFVLHIAYLAYAIPPSVIFSDLPYDGVDYQTHYEQLKIVKELLEKYGHLWGYDPFLLAGQPAGLIFDVDNKAYFLFTFGLIKAGVSTPVAYKIFTPFVSLLAPICIWLAAGLFGMTARQRLWALGLAIAVWHVDHSTRFMWSVGMVSFATTSYLAVLVLALFYRYINEPSKVRWIATALLLALSLLVHVWAFAILVVPLLSIYIRRFRQLSKPMHASVWAMALLALSANLYWLYPALQHFDLVAPSGLVGQTTPLYLLSDWLEIFVNPFNTFFTEPHTLYRYAALFAAVVTVINWRKEGDPRANLAMVSLAWLLFLSFFIALIPGLREVEPYRFVVPLTMVAIVFAPPWLAKVFSREFIAGLAPNTKVAALFVMLLLLPRCAKVATYAFPDAIPLPASTSTVHDIVRVPNTIGPGLLLQRDLGGTSMRMRDIPEMPLRLARFLDERCVDDGRILVQHGGLGEFLRWASSKPILGGFPDRRLYHEAANLFRRAEDPRKKGERFAAYLVRYNARYLVMTDYEPIIEKRRDLLKPFKLIGPHRIYRVRHHADYVALGRGRVKAALNRIEVSSARPAKGTEKMVLRFHYLSTLRCRPNCRLERFKLPYDRIGFIGVVGTPKLPAKFVIEQTY